LHARPLLALIGLLLAGFQAGAQDLLDPEVAFRTTARLIKPDLIEVRYQTAPGYYLYRDRLAYALDPAEARLGSPKLPAGKTKHDQFFGRQVIYRNLTIVTLPVAVATDAPLILTADLQGCADLGVCYPPLRRRFTLKQTESPVK
jgi:thiol:disulfide interchange protein DsbD